jgi:hypothetical protein
MQVEVTRMMASFGSSMIGIRHLLAAEVLLALPADRFHGRSSGAVAFDVGHPDGGDHVQGRDRQHDAEGQLGVAPLGMAGRERDRSSSDVENVAGDPRPQRRSPWWGSLNSAMPVAISRAPNSARVACGEVFRPRKRLTALAAPAEPNILSSWPTTSAGLTSAATTTG